MKTLLANAANAVITKVAKLMVKTDCIVVCHRPDAPEELFK